MTDCSGSPSLPPVLDHIHYVYILIKLNINMECIDMNGIEYNSAVIRNCMDCLTSLNASSFDTGSVGHLTSWHLFQIDNGIDHRSRLLYSLNLSCFFSSCYC
jgi:surface protein